MRNGAQPMLFILSLSTKYTRDKGMMREKKRVVTNGKKFVQTIYQKVCYFFCVRVFFLHFFPCQSIKRLLSSVFKHFALTKENKRTEKKICKQKQSFQVSFLCNFLYLHEGILSILHIAPCLTVS